MKAIQIGSILAVLVSSLSLNLYLYDKVYGGWSTAEGIAIQEVAARRGFTDCEHYQTVDNDDSVRVLFNKPEPGHYIDVTMRKDRHGKWAVYQFNKDFEPWKKDAQASR